MPALGNRVSLGSVTKWQAPDSSCSGYWALFLQNSAQEVVSELADGFTYFPYKGPVHQATNTIQHCSEVRAGTEASVHTQDPDE